MQKVLRRLWTRVIAFPTRLLMSIMSRGQPRDEYLGIRFMVADRWLLPEANRFFQRTRTALQAAELRAPHAYAELCKDVKQVLLWNQTTTRPYNRFQLAAVVSSDIALRADMMCFTAWLLYTSGLLHGQNEAQLRSGELLASLEPDQRGAVAAWLKSEFHCPAGYI
jgi:hypothetical protein